MDSTKANYPEVGEFVLVTVKKILPYGAFLSLDEYPGIEGFLHISNVSSGWVRNIREHLREGQKTVAKIHSVDIQKGLIDLTLKQITEADKRRKMESYQTEKKSRKLLELAGNKLKKPVAVTTKEIIEPLLKAYGSLGTALESLYAGDTKVKLDQAWHDVLKDILEKEFRPKVVSNRSKLMLKFNSSDGVLQLRGTLANIEKLGDEKVKVTLHYLGAPHYYLDVESVDLKAVSKTVEKADAILQKASKDFDCEYSLEELKR